MYGSLKQNSEYTTPTGRYLKRIIYRVYRKRFIRLIKYKYIFLFLLIFNKQVIQMGELR